MRGKVLVIEDDPRWQGLLKEYLENENFYVEVVDNLIEGLEKIKKENFHFITVDLQLDTTTIDPTNYEGWKLLEKIVTYGLKTHMGTLVITGFEKDYERVKKIKKLEGTYLMAKKDFNRKKFVETVINSVEQFDVRFHDDKRSS